MTIANLTEAEYTAGLTALTGAFRPRWTGTGHLHPELAPPWGFSSDQVR